MSLYTSQIDGYNSIDGSQTEGGTGNYTSLPDQSAGFGGGSSGGGGTARINWVGTVSAPVTSTAYIHGAWFPYKDASGNDLPLWHIGNPTEFHTSLHIIMSYDFSASGTTSGDAGISVINLASFGVFCSSCTGLPTNYFNGNRSYFSGNLYGAGTGAFSDTASGKWDIQLTLAPFSTAEIFATLASDVTMTAQAAAAPEPASWMMMVFGVGAVGYTARRKRRPALA